MSLLAALLAVCSISGKHVSRAGVTVALSGGETLTVGVDDARIVATPAASGPTDLAITGAIAFHGTAERIWYSTTAPVTVAGGQVVLTSGSHLIGQRADGSDLIGDAVVYSDDTEPSEGTPAGETIDAVRVRCDQLSLDWLMGNETETALGDGTDWTTVGHTPHLVLRSEPRSAARGVTFSSARCGDTACLRVLGLEHRAGWRRVAVRNEGVVATGWVADKELARIPEDVMVGYSYCGCSNSSQPIMGGIAGGPAPRAARIKVGTQVFASRGAQPWATVQRDDVQFEVRVTAGDPYAWVTAIPGIRGVTTAYVPVSALIP